MNEPDETLTRAERADAIKALSGRPYRKVGPEELPKGALGTFDGRKSSPTFREIRVLETLDPITRERVLAHEFGHLLHEYDGVIRGLPATDEITRELLTIYSDLNSPRLYALRALGREPSRSSHPELWEWDPWKRGYETQKKVISELLAEAGRAYLSDPNYIKTVAPNTAAAIREGVNSHPVLSKVIQFNTLAGGAVSAAALAEALRNYKPEQAGGL